MCKKTPLFDSHERANAKIIPFAGYMLPVSYPSGIITEHMAVRHSAGLFDVSHMGEFILRGTDALKNLNYILTNDFSDMPAGAARYSPMCNAHGGIIDDLIVYKIHQDEYLIVVNASNKDKDFEHISATLRGNAQIDDVSDDIALLALQGPKAYDIILLLTEKDNIPQKRYSAKFDVLVSGISCTLSRTGYTGEDGFELYCTSHEAEALWDAILSAGKEYGIMPCGLGARDTLRIEAGMPLYGHEMNDDISPMQTSLSMFVKMKKDDFIGKDSMIASGNSTKMRVGLKMLDRGIARENCPVYSGDKLIGNTTSGTHCPYLQGAYAMAIVSGAETGDIVNVSVKGKHIRAEVVSLPFYKLIK